MYADDDARARRYARNVLEILSRQRLRFAVSLAVVAIALIAFVACEGAETYSVVADCTKDDASSTSCTRGLSYTCMSGSIPSDSDPKLICESAVSTTDGETTFCCLSSTSAPSTCSADETLACATGEVGYACSGSDTPLQIDPSLECVRVPTAASAGYCCVSEGGTLAVSCAQGAVDAGGCPGGTTVFLCPSSTTPQASEPTLNCGPPAILSNGYVSYCCS